MRYDVAALRAAAQAALDAERAEWDRQQAEQAAKAEQHQAEWQETWRDPWINALTAALRKAKRGAPVTRDMFPHADRFDNRAAFFQPLTTNTRPYAPSRDLTALIQILDTLADPVVSSTSLRELGISSNGLQLCVQHMAKQTVRR